MLHQNHPYIHLIIIILQNKTITTCIPINMLFTHDSTTSNLSLIITCLIVGLIDHWTDSNTSFLCCYSRVAENCCLTRENMYVISCPVFSRELSAGDTQVLAICRNDQEMSRAELEKVQKGKIDLYKIGHGIILKSKVKNLRASRRQWGKTGQRMRISNTG